MNNSKPLAILAYIVGVLLILLGAYYFMTPANALPHFLPGYLADSTKTHFKHGIGSLLLGLAALAFGWFQSGPSKSTPE